VVGQSADNGSSAVDHLPPKIVIGAPAYAAEAGLATCRVVAESSGLTTPPCGVPRLLFLPPLMRRFPLPSRSSTGVRSHSLISHSTCLSTMRRATDLRRSECGIVSKYYDKSASTTSVYPRQISQRVSLIASTALRRGR
jgi:hypothetical protein